MRWMYWLGMFNGIMSGVNAFFAGRAFAHGNVIGWANLAVATVELGAVGLLWAADELSAKRRER